MKITRYDLGFIGLLLISPALFPLMIILDFIEGRIDDRKFKKEYKKIKCWKCGKELFFEKINENKPVLMLECKKCGHG